MEIIDVQGTTGSMGQWTLPSLGKYPIGQVVEATYAVPESGVQVNDVAIIKFAGQSIGKVEPNFTNSIVFDVDLKNNSIQCILANAGVGVVNQLAVWGDGQPDIPWIYIKVQVVQR